MTLRHMLIFRTLCQLDFHSTRTAQALHMTQPAVSLAIKELEQYYGVRLFDRLGRRLQITPAGEQFLRYAVHICALFEDMETGLRNWDHQGTLRVGASITIGSQFLPRYVGAFAQLCPETEVRAVIEPSDRLEQKLLANQLDFALIEGIAHDPNITARAYMEDRLAVVCPADGRWIQGQVLSQELFRQQRFLLREPGSGTREVFDRVVRQAGFSVSPVWESTSTTALVNAVIHGLGIAVLPQRMVQPAVSLGQVVTVEVEGLSFVRSFSIIHHKDKFLTASARQFMALCLEQEAPGL